MQSKSTTKVNKLQHVAADTDAAAIDTKPILGTFEGECADANITNLNGLDITRPVWETVFASDEFKKAIELGHYIGFLGHPEDSNCQDFKDGCIVMTDGWIDDDGKVYGKFNLIDSPVGRIVKAFIDAGVRFGISVRGAGDIVNNSVEPDTFVFRGFDLVAFPAYPNSIPTFTAIAAATDSDSQAKYRSICAAVEKNLSALNTVESIDILAAQFAEQSDTYSRLQERRAELETADAGNTEVEEEIDAATQIQVLTQKVQAMTHLYLENIEASNALSQELKDLRAAHTQLERKLKSVRRITSAQQADLTQGLEDVTASYEAAVTNVNKLTEQNKTLLQSNLKYKQNIDASTVTIKSKDSDIAKLNAKLAETVRENADTAKRTSNLDAENKKLSQKLTAATALVQEYQDAYANLYANALGVGVNNVKVTASTSVTELQDLIRGNRVTPQTQIKASVDFDLPDADDLVTL